MVKVSVVFNGVRKFITYRNLGKSADILFKNKGIVSTFFVWKKFIVGCRDPPFINSNYLDFELIGGKMVKIPVRNKSKDNPYTLGYDEEKMYIQ